MIINRCCCNQTNASSEVCGESNTGTKRFKLSQMQKVVEDHDSDEVADKIIYIHIYMCALNEISNDEVLYPAGI